MRIDIAVDDAVPLIIRWRRVAAVVAVAVVVAAAVTTGSILTMK
ncbi:MULTISPECIES: hypothetical protein [Bacillales]|nr:hypothetical protein [Lysinibacillus halotolerans]